MMFPLRPHERAVNLECSASALGPLPPAGLGRGSPAAGGSAPPGFGIYNLQMTYDSAIGAILLLGATGIGSLNGTETWMFSGGSWSQLSPSHSPESCYGSALAFDSVDNYTVYLGGANIGAGSSCASAGQTWMFRAGDWSQLHPAVSPSPRQDAALSNDSADGYLLLFGGVNSSCSSGVCADTWKFVGGAWTQLAPKASPPARAGAGLTYDSADGHMVMFGGVTDVTSLTSHSFWVAMLNDTWSYRGGNWTALSPVGPVPPEVYDDGFVYDAADGVAVYTCADNNASGPYSDPEIYWTFAGGNFTDGSSTSGLNSKLPPNRLAEALAYDWKDGYVVLYGGTGTQWQRLTDTWAYHAGVWTNLSRPGAFAATLVIAPSEVLIGHTVQFNVSVIGSSGTYTYAYAGLPPGCSSSNASTLSCTPNSVGSFQVVASVKNSSGVYSNASASLVVDPLLSIAYFEGVPNPIFLGEATQLSLSASGGIAPYSYWYRGLPPGCRPTNAALIDCVPVRAGGYGVVGIINDSAGESAQADLNLTVTGPPPPTAPIVRSFLATPDPVQLGSPVTYLADVASSEPLTFQYVGLPPGCASVNASAFGCVPQTTGTFGTELTVTDPFLQSAFANFSLVVSPSGSSGTALDLVSFVPSPAVVALGGSTVFEVTVQGGVPPYAYRFSGLPAPCETVSASSLPCSPNHDGNYSVGVVITDAAHNSTAGSTVLIVLAPWFSPAPVASSAAPSTGPTWLDLGLVVAVTGLGVALIAVAWPSKKAP
jgi:hypothetical protein